MTKEKFVLKALEYLNYPSIKYIGPMFGQDEFGFDCSGFVTFLLKSIKFPELFHRHCNEYFDSFGIFVHKYQIGDLVFFSKRSKGLFPDHMGIIISGSRYIHSPGKNNHFIKISELELKQIPKIQNQIYTTNPIGFKRATIKKGRFQQIFFS